MSVERQFDLLRGAAWLGWHDAGEKFLKRTMSVSGLRFYAHMEMEEK